MALSATQNVYQKCEALQGWLSFAMSIHSPCLFLYADGSLGDRHRLFTFQTESFKPALAVSKHYCLYTANAH